MLSPSDLALLQRPATRTPEPEPFVPDPWVPPPRGTPTAEYRRLYHQWRQANDPEYRARRVAAATRHKEQHRGK